MPEVALKASISGPAVAPKAAVVDPALAVGSPPPLTAACGADALGHAIESCMSRRANPISSALAGRAVALIVENLPGAVENPDDAAPREPLALAATLAGAAFSAAGVTMTHAIAQALGGVLHVPHGAGVAIGTPSNLRYNLDHCIEEYAELARWCRLPGDQPRELAERFVDCICDLLERIGLPAWVEPPTDAPPDLADRLARNAVLSTPVPLKLNPRPIDEAGLKEVFQELLRGA
jgi:alcohol dehydrogenase